MAVELARLAIQGDPNSTEAIDVLLGAGLKSQDRGLLDEVYRLVDAAVARAPANERLQLFRAQALAAMDRLTAAIPELEAYCRTKQGSGNLEAIATLADLYRLTGDADRAGQWIERVEQLAPDSQIAVHARFLWLVSQERFEGLKDISSKYISAKDQDPTIVVRAASTLLSLDPLELKKEGVKLFEHAVALAPGSAEARVNLASALYQTGDFQGAEKVYRDLLGRYPNDVRVLNDLAWILQEHDRRYDEALVLANKGLGIAPDDLHLLDTRGTILSNMPSRLSEAKADFARLVEVSSPDTMRQAKALLQLGRVCAKLNDLASAKQHLEKALEIDRKMQVFTADERSEIASILQPSGT